MKEEQCAEVEDKIRKVAKQHGAEVTIIRAPEDPKAKRAWVRRMRKFVIDQQFVGQKCAFCGHVYDSVADFEKRNPKRGYRNDLCVCFECWQPYLTAQVDSPRPDTTGKKVQPT